MAEMLETVVVRRSRRADAAVTKILLMWKPKRNRNRMLDERAGWPLNKY